MKSTLKLFSVLFVAAFAMLLTGCKESPVDAAKKWHAAAYKKGDKSKAMEHASGAVMKAKTENITNVVKHEKSIAFGDAKLDGDMASGYMTKKVESGNGKSTAEFELEKSPTDGKWKISNIREKKSRKTE